MRRLLLVVAILTAARQGFAGNTDVAEFKREYPDAARRLVGFAETLSGKIEIVESNSVRKTTTRQSGEFQADRGLFRFVMEKPDGAGGRSTIATGAGPGGTYTPTKNSSDSKNSYGVASLGGDQKDREIVNQRFGRYIHASHSMGGTDLAKVIRASTLRNLTVEPVVDKGRSLKCVKFDVGPEERVNRVSVNLDPSASWAIVDWTYEVLMKESGTFSKTSGSVEYGPPIDGMPVPKVVQVNDVAGRKYVTQFTDLSRPKLPSDRFSMSELDFPNWSASRLRG